MNMRIQSQPHIAGQQFVLFLGEHRVDLSGRRPSRRAMFLALPGVALIGGEHTQAHDIGRREQQDAHGRAFRPVDTQGMFHCQG